MKRQFSMTSRLARHLKLSIQIASMRLRRRIFLLTIPWRRLRHRRSNPLILLISLWLMINSSSSRDSNQRMSRRKSLPSHKGSTIFLPFLIQRILSIQIFRTFEQIIFFLSSSEKNHRTLISFSTTLTSTNFIWRKPKDIKHFWMMHLPTSTSAWIDQISSHMMKTTRQWSACS